MVTANNMRDDWWKQAVVYQIYPRSFKDVNGDGLITTDDKTIIGDAYPDFTGGFSTNLSWKGLDFSASFVYSYGG